MSSTSFNLKNPFLFFPGVCVFQKFNEIAFIKVKFFIWEKFIIFQNMQSIKSSKSNMQLSLRTVTWYKDSHSLFDYQSNKVTTTHHTFPVNSTNNLSIYRKRQASQIAVLDEKDRLLFDSDQFQFLTQFKLKHQAGENYSINFVNQPEPSSKQINSEKLNTQSSKSMNQLEEETYLIVRKQKDAFGNQRGYTLQPGQTIKLGRIQFFVSEISIDGKVKTPNAVSKNKMKLNDNVFKYKKAENLTTEEKNACKICLEEAEEETDFLLNPCRCAGSCGTVHLNCLLQWIGVKVKKEVIGGTLHYNFEKFECEVCKAELPVRIQTQKGRMIELLPIEKPNGNYMILESACQKSKSVLMVKNVPEEGIKLGRGHECEIRITDISVSRNHALIKFIGNSFIVFDNKSKFGTLIKQQNMEITLSPESPQAVQIGRSVIVVELSKEALQTQKSKTQYHSKVGDKMNLKQIQTRKAQQRK